jgi:hypothetical protein
MGQVPIKPMTCSNDGEALATVLTGVLWAIIDGGLRQLRQGKGLFELRRNHMRGVTDHGK